MALHQHGLKVQPMRARIGCQPAPSRPSGSSLRTSRTQMSALTQKRAETKKDATAELLAGAIKFALQSRLRTHKGINVDVQSNAFDLMGGKFGGMTVVGTGWRTPLQLTAQMIKVAVGELQVDSAALLFQQRVALKNVPIGSCTLTLSPGDLGNFMVHDIMKGTAAKAVQGQAFAFDPSSVQYTHTGAGAGQVLYEGTCSVGGKPHAYAVAMDAPISAHTPTTTTHSHTQHAHKHHASRGSTPPPPIRVRARRLTAGTKHAHAHTHPAHTTHVARPVTTAVQLAVEDPPAVHATEDHSQVEELVGNELSRLFSSLRLNLQGVELSAPRLRLMEQPGGTPEQKAPMFLEIHATLRLLDVPPLNMQF